MIRFSKRAIKRKKIMIKEFKFFTKKFFLQSKNTIFKKKLKYFKLGLTPFYISTNLKLNKNKIFEIKFLLNSYNYKTIL